MKAGPASYATSCPNPPKNLWITVVNDRILLSSKVQMHAGTNILSGWNSGLSVVLKITIKFGGTKIW